MKQSLRRPLKNGAKPRLFNYTIKCPGIYLTNERAKKKKKDFKCEADYISSVCVSKATKNYLSLTNFHSAPVTILEYPPIALNGRKIFQASSIRKWNIVFLEAAWKGKMFYSHLRFSFSI